MSALVSIITVNYKQAQVTCELLESIGKLAYNALEVIVVDNGQSGDDTSLYQSVLPNVRVINSSENIGFAGGNNLGIQAATGEFLFLVNNDTELDNGLIESLLTHFEDDHVGAVSPILKYYDHPDQIQFAGFTEINPITGANELVRKAKSSYPYFTPYFHGAAVMLRRSVVDQCGLMPEEFFLYYEELEWSRIIRSHGFELLVDPTVHVLHKESISTGKNSPLKLYYQTRNRLHFMRRNGFKNWTLFMLFFMFLSTPKQLVRSLLSREWAHLSAFSKAWTDGLLHKRFGFRPL